MLTKQQEFDSEKCEEMTERGEDMECLDCSCSVCLAQQNNFTIDALVKKVHENAVKHGFWDDWKLPQAVKENGIANGYTGEEDFLNDGINNALGNRLMLIVSEVAEAQEGLRHRDIDNFKEELADIVIRTADLCGGLNINLESEILKKMQKNKDRPYKHGKEF